MLKSIVVFCVLILATVSAFNAPVTVSTRPARMTMLFDFFKKKAVVEKVEPAAKAGAKVVAKKFTPTKAKAVVDAKFKPGQGAAGKAGYIPDGLSKEQYAKFVAGEEAKMKARKIKFPLGKNAETLTEWMLAEEKKGNVGKGLLSNHRLVKCKYEGWYTDESPV